MSQFQSDDRTTPKTRYRSFLLRLWQEEPSGERRAMLQDVVSGESLSFPNLESLTNHLSATMGGQEGKMDTSKPE